MKRTIPYLSIMLAACMLFVACKKEDKLNPNDSANLQIQSDDQSRVAGEVDAVADDANVIFNHPDFNNYGLNTPVGENTVSVNNVICDATVAVDTISNPRKITVTYDGTNCVGNRSRSGSVVISIARGIRWSDAGAAISITFNNLKVKRLADNKSLTLNGTHTITNTSGGKLINLPTGITITHTITSSNMSLTFDNAMQRNWQVAKQRVFTYNNGVVITTTGVHNDGTRGGIAEWGTNRFGIAFASAISAPIVIRQDCAFRVVSGQVTHHRADVTTTATFGLDVNGISTTCPGTGKYYFKLVWTNRDQNYTVILPY